MATLTHLGPIARETERRIKQAQSWSKEELRGRLNRRQLRARVALDNPYSDPGVLLSKNLVLLVSILATCIAGTWLLLGFVFRMPWPVSSGWPSYGLWLTVPSCGHALLGLTTHAVERRGLFTWLAALVGALFVIDGYSAVAVVAAHVYYALGTLPAGTAATYSVTLYFMAFMALLGLLGAELLLMVNLLRIKSIVYDVALRNRRRVELFVQEEDAAAAAATSARVSGGAASGPRL